MINTIDADHRRRELAEAVWRLILDRGLSEVSVRKVAEEAGLATGSVRHFFPSQAQLLNFAMTALAETVTERIRAISPDDDPRRRVIAILTELLPLTDRTYGEFAAYLEFLERSRTDPALRDVARESIRAVRELIVTILGDLRTLGILRPNADVAVEAVRLHAFIDGLTLQLIIAPELNSRNEARDALAHWLRDLEEVGE